MAESKRDYYEVLGVSKDADEATLKKAYRQVAKKYHPDMNPGDVEAEKKFKEASEAYAVLSDPEKRRQYDQFGHAAFDGSAGAGGGYGGFDFNGADFGDIFGDIFGDLFGGGRRGGRANQGPMKGMNIRKSVRITFEEVKFATEVGEVSLRTEPGVLTMYAVSEKENPCMVTILETYASQKAYELHIASEHFQKYKQGTLHMVKRLTLADQMPLNPANQINNFIQ